MVPQFNKHGFLPSGIHTSDMEEFQARFLTGQHRDIYAETIRNVVDHAGHMGASAIIFGGSFVSDKENPADVDCVLIFKNQQQIPPRITSIEIEGHGLDVFYASYDQEELVASFVRLLSLNRFNDEVGIVQINLSQNELDLLCLRAPRGDFLDAIRQTYSRRRIVSKTDRKRVLITIHGIRTTAEWNAEVSLNASANGWVTAPFTYGFVGADIFLDKTRRMEIVDEFRQFVFRIQREFGIDNISIIAHSFGTYVIMSYITGFDETPVKFDTVILCGAIVSADLDLGSLSDRVGMFLNERAPNDEWAGKARMANLWQDKLLGYAGIDGFKTLPSNLIQRSSNIFTHSNVIRQDVVVQRWLPTLEAYCGSVRRSPAKR